MPDAVFQGDLLDVFVNRTNRFVYELYQADGTTPQALNASDVVRFKIWDDDNEDPPDLDIDSQTVTSQAFTASGAVLTSSGHGLNDGNAVRLTTSGTLPAGLSLLTTYYVVGADRTAGTFGLAATRGGSAITTTDAGSGTHTYTASSSVTINTVGSAGTTPAKVTIEVGQEDTADQTTRLAHYELAVVENATGKILPYLRGDQAANIVGSAGGAIGLD